jgi:hypothetical protein
MIDRIRETLSMRRDKAERFHLGFFILLDNPGAKPPLPFGRRGARRRTGLGKSRGLIGGGPNLAQSDRHRRGLPQIAEGFGIKPKRRGQCSKGCVLHVGLGHRLDGNQPSGSQPDLPAQFLGGLIGFHPMPPHKFAEMDNLGIHDCSSYQMFWNMK